MTISRVIYVLITSFFITFGFDTCLAFNLSKKTHNCKEITIHLFLDMEEYQGLPLEDKRILVYQYAKGSDHYCNDSRIHFILWVSGIYYNTMTKRALSFPPVGVSQVAEIKNIESLKKSVFYLGVPAPPPPPKINSKKGIDDANE